MSIDAMKQALKALENVWSNGLEELTTAPMEALRAAIEQAEQPVALETVYETIIQWDEGGGKRSRRELARRILALYATPPQRTWVGLTDEDREDIMRWIEWKEVGSQPVAPQKLISYVEKKLKGKNT